MRGLSSDVILEATPPNVVQTIKPALKSHFQACCAVALRKIDEDPGDAAGWKLLIFFQESFYSHLVGVKNHVCRKSSCFAISFWIGDGRNRFACQIHHLQKNTSKSDQTKQAALRLVRCGELSRVARVLTSGGLSCSCL